MVSEVSPQIAVKDRVSVLLRLGPEEKVVVTLPPVG